jgi:hypothetical protein
MFQLSGVVKSLCLVIGMWVFDGFRSNFRFQFRFGWL